METHLVLDSRQARRASRDGELRARADAELGVDPRQVALHGPDGDEELRCDLLVRETRGDELCDPALRLAQLADVRACARGCAPAPAPPSRPRAARRAGRRPRAHGRAPRAPRRGASPGARSSPVRAASGRARTAAAAVRGRRGRGRAAHAPRRRRRAPPRRAPGPARAIASCHDRCVGRPFSSTKAIASSASSSRPTRNERLDLVVDDLRDRELSDIRRGGAPRRRARGVARAASGSPRESSTKPEHSLRPQRVASVSAFLGEREGGSPRPDRLVQQAEMSLDGPWITSATVSSCATPPCVAIATHRRASRSASAQFPARSSTSASRRSTPISQDSLPALSSRAELRRQQRPRFVRQSV